MTINDTIFQYLSGSLALLWCTFALHMALSIGMGALKCTSLGDQLYPGPCPPQMLLHLPNARSPLTTYPSGRGRRGAPTEIEVQINYVDDDGHRPCRLSPYVAMVDAMHSVEGAFVPVDIFVKVGRQEFPNMPNNIEEYRKRLRRLRQLYSRTTEECCEERERRGNDTGTRLDGNVVPTCVICSRRMALTAG